MAKSNFINSVIKKLTIFLLFSAFVIDHCVGQIEFQSGYFIDNDGQTIECLIKDVGWKNNPMKFQYKLNENSEYQIAEIRNVREFSVSNIKYKRYITRIDRSSNQTSKLGFKKDPEYQREILLLKVLVEGNASLFSYTQGNLIRYFFSINDSEVEMLVNKKYLNPNNDIRTNNSFKQQLWITLNCGTLNRSDAENIGYNDKDLIRYFNKYNTCINPNFIVSSEKAHEDRFNLNIRPGLIFSSFSLQSISPNSLPADFGSKLNFRIGIEMEFILPFNKNKWAVLVEPTYQSYSANTNAFSITTTIDYKSIEFPIGLRHYFYLGDRSKIFVDLSYLLDKPLNSTIEPIPTLDLGFTDNLNMGIGYNYNNKYSIEFKYAFNRDPLNQYFNWTADYKSASLILGYNIF